LTLVFRASNDIARILLLLAVARQVYIRRNGPGVGASIPHGGCGVWPGGGPGAEPAPSFADAGPPAIDLVDPDAVHRTVTMHQSPTRYGPIPTVLCDGEFLRCREHRGMAGVEEDKPPPAIWMAAANAPVHQAIVDGLACDTFDTPEFAAVMNRER
jgi:hypothetical protein